MKLPALIFHCSPCDILHPMDDLRALCARLSGNELVAAECENLTGGWPDSDGVALCQSLDLLARAAYLSTGLRCLAQAATLPELITHLQSLHLSAERFRVEFLDLTAASPISKPSAILAIANVIEANPDLTHPQHRFICVVQHSRLWLGEVVCHTSRSYLRHETKPYRTSSSLPTRLARALVNLVAPPASSILDPFCGTGSILLEAQALGLSSFGMDSNPKMVGMSRRNLTHFGYPAQVELGEAHDCQQDADAIVTDLPYGCLLLVDYPVIQAALAHLVQLAPRAIYLAAADLSSSLLQAGYAQVDVMQVRKRHGLCRYVHRCLVW